MIAVIRAELLRLVRPRVLLGALGLAVAFAAVAAFAVFASATGPGEPPLRGGATLAELGKAGGATAAFAIGSGFAGLLVFVTAIALSATEWSSGTFRSLALRQPSRIRIVLGQLAARLVLLVAFLAVAEVLTALAATVAAGGQDVATGAWWSIAGFGDATVDLATTAAGLAGWMVFGTALGTIVRSVPVALGVGVAWAGPFENITVDSWTTGRRVFPGQVLRAVINGGTGDLAFGPALLRSTLYVAVAGLVALTVVSRRDVTA